MNVQLFNLPENPIFPPILGEMPSPLSVLTEARTSSLHGFGVFACKKIPKGSIWWRGVPGQNILLVSKSQFLEFQKSAQNELTRHFLNMVNTYHYYCSTLDSLVVCLDNMRYVNHSFTPNSGAHESNHPFLFAALRDIFEGEEIVENYGQYEVCPWEGVRNFDISKYLV